MPGRSGIVKCPNCKKEHSFSDGGGFTRDKDHKINGNFSYEHYTCPLCQTLRSSAEENPSCGECDTALIPWPGDIGPDHLHGPCPACQAPMSEDDEVGGILMWD